MFGNTLATDGRGNGRAVVADIGRAVVADIGRAIVADIGRVVVADIGRATGNGRTVVADIGRATGNGRTVVADIGRAAAVGRARAAAVGIARNTDTSTFVFGLAILFRGVNETFVWSPVAAFCTTLYRLPLTLKTEPTTNASSNAVFLFVTTRK